MDSSDQKRLREVVANEVEAVLKKHDVGGAVILVSKESAAWRVVHPDWAGIHWDVTGAQPGLRVKWNASEGREKADSTLHFVAAIHELSNDFVNVYGRVWRHVMQVLNDKGVGVDHKPFGGGKGVGGGDGKGRPDPMGGKFE